VDSLFCNDEDVDFAALCGIPPTAEVLLTEAPPTPKFDTSNVPAMYVAIHARETLMESQRSLQANLDILNQKLDEFSTKLDEFSKLDKKGTSEENPGTSVENPPALRQQAWADVVDDDVLGVVGTETETECRPVLGQDSIRTHSDTHTHTHTHHTHTTHLSDLAEGSHGDDTCIGTVNAVFGGSGDTSTRTHIHTHTLTSENTGLVHAVTDEHNDNLKDTGRKTRRGKRAGKKPAVAG
jgi:hypothetical protein